VPQPWRFAATGPCTLKKSGTCHCLRGYRAGTAAEVRSDTPTLRVCWPSCEGDAFEPGLEIVFFAFWRIRGEEPVLPWISAPSAAAACLVLPVLIT